MNRLDGKFLTVDDSLHVHQAGAVGSGNIFGPGFAVVLILSFAIQTDTACSSIANIPPKPQHSSTWDGSHTSMSFTMSSKSRNLL